MKKSFGDRSFSVSVPTLWNALPACLRNISSIFIFNLDLVINMYIFSIF